MPSKHNLRYTPIEKMFIALVSMLYVQSRHDMEKVIAPKLAALLGRTECAICKQIELVLGKHWLQQF